MRTLLVVLFAVIVSLAGCSMPDDGGPADAIDADTVHVDDICDLGICAPRDEDMTDVDLQPHAVPLLAFHQDDVAAVYSVLRTDDGWVITLRDTEGSWSILLIHEGLGSAERYALPATHTVGDNGLLLDGDRLFATSWVNGARSGVTLHELNLDTGVATTQELDLPTPARPVGIWNDDLLMVAEKGLLNGDSAAWVYDGSDLVAIGTTGRVMDAAMVTGLLYLVIQDAGNWSVEMQDISGGFRFPIWSSASPIAGIWGEDGHVAFSVIKDTSDPAGGEIWEVDHRRHTLSRLGQGWDVQFYGDGVAYLTASGESSPFIAEWNRGLASYSEGNFLPDGNRWDITDQGIWWLEIPRIDHRFKEVPNPTPYTTMLMAADR